MALSGQAASKLNFGAVCLKWCPACLLEDEQTLVASSGGIDRRLILPDPGMPYDSLKPSEQELYLSAFITELHRYLCVQSPVSPPAKFYQQWLGQQGYLTARGHLRCQTLILAMSEFWQGLFTVSTPMLPLGLANFRYVSALVHGDRSHHYLKHLLLMAFVSRSPAEFFSIEEPQVLPVPVPPVRDGQVAERTVLSLLSEQIPMRQIARKTGHSVGYIKQLALRHHQPFEHRTQRITTEVERGIWRQAFMGVGRQQIARCHGVSVSAVEAIIQSHQGLSDWRRHLRRVHRQREHRETVTAYLVQHADASRGGVEQMCRTAYTWLYKYDRVWLYQQLPAAKRAVYHPSVDWAQRDRELAAQLEQMGGLARSLSALERALGRPDCLRKNNVRLPLSYALAVWLVAAYAAQHATP